MKLWKHSFRIYRADMRKLLRNWVAAVIALGLALLPSLYAWVNIYASWDPYGNTSGIKVGIVNEDEGSSIQDIPIDIGAQVAGTLKENEKLGWTFFDTRDEGIERVTNGDVYATIIIPRDFSAKMATVLDETPQKPELDYYVNEKINAIAPKMTDSGASTLQKQITASFTQTVVEKVFSVLNDVGADVDNNYDKIEKYKNLLYFADEDLPHIGDRLDGLIASAQNGIVRIDDKNEDVQFLKEALGRAVNFADSFGQEAGELGQKAQESAPPLKDSLSELQTLLGDVRSAAENVSTDYQAERPDLISDIGTAADTIDRIADKLEELADASQNLFTQEQREAIINKNKEINADLTILRNTLAEVREQVNTLQSAAGLLGTLDEINRDLNQKMKELKSLVDGSFQNLDDGLAAAENILAKLEGFSIRDTIRDKIDEELNALRQHLPLFQNIINAAGTIDSAEDQTQIELKKIQLSTVIESARTNINLQRSSISRMINDLQELTGAASKAARSANSALRSVGSTTKSTISALVGKVDRTRWQMDEINDWLAAARDEDTRGLAQDIPKITENLALLKSRLEELGGALGSEENLTVLMDDIIRLCWETGQNLERVIPKIDGELMDKVQKYLSATQTVAGELSGLFQSGAANLDGARAFLGRLTEGGEIGVGEIEQFKDSLPVLYGGMDKVAGMVRQLDGMIDLKQLARVMQNGAETEGDFFSSPINLNTHPLFHMQNYGAGLTPFYTTLCLWVGALLLTALLTTKAKNADFAYTPNEEFVGKYLTFLTVALLQGFIAAMGDIFVLGVEMVHPVLFVLLAMLYSTVFSMITYCLVSLLGNVGKAVGVVFLVIQLAGAGGTFPIQVTPQFFQVIHKFLPFTYGIGGMREAVGGIVYPALMKDILVLAGYFVLFAAMGLVLKQFANQKLKRFSKKLGESGIIEH